jgi:S1-C subfamily serine protease
MGKRYSQIVTPIRSPTTGADANTTGVLVSEVMPNFPMYNAGVREGDILTSFDGNALDNFGEAKVSWSSGQPNLFLFYLCFAVNLLID